MEYFFSNFFSKVKHLNTERTTTVDKAVDEKPETKKAGTRTIAEELDRKLTGQTTIKITNSAV